jgi:hypothetical protein
VEPFAGRLGPGILSPGEDVHYRREYPICEIAITNQVIYYETEHHKFKNTGAWTARFYPAIEK